MTVVPIDDIAGAREWSKEAASLRLWVSAMEDAGDTVLQSQSFADACIAVGMDPPAEVKKPHALQRRSYSDLSSLYEASDKDSRVLLAATRHDASGYAVDYLAAERVAGCQLSARERSNAVKFAAVRANALRLAAEQQQEIGIVGTKSIRGRISVEQNSLMLPFMYRGRSGQPKIGREMYTTDTGMFKHANEITGHVTSGIFEPKIPKEYDERTAAVVKRLHRAICNVRGGQRRFKRNAMLPAITDGFSVFEPCWERAPDGLIRPWKLEPRETSTVDGWVFDERGSELIGANFVAPTDGGAKERYFLPRGTDPLTSRLLLISLNSIGNNVEGVSPGRPCVGLRRMKELILTCYGIGFQKHGAPIAQVMFDLVDATIGELGGVGTEAHKAEVAALLVRLRDIRARLGAVLPIPLGIRVEYVTPAADLPDPVEFLKYIDFAIALAYSNEGALLGQGSGSYALASAKEGSFMSSAASYALALAEGYEELMRVGLTANLGELESYPEYGVRFAGTQDGPAWVNAQLALTNLRIGQQPVAVQEMAESIQGLPKGTFAEQVATGNEGLPTGTEDSPDGRASGGDDAAV